MCRHRSHVLWLSILLMGFLWAADAGDVGGGKIDNNNIIDDGFDDMDTVFVLGAGISGLVAARTLLEEASSWDEKGKSLRVVVLEAKSDRIGGRLWSASLPSMHKKKNTLKTHFGVDFGGSSLHGGSGSALGRYLSSNKGRFPMVDWGSSIYPARNHAEWWNFQNETSIQRLNLTQIHQTEQFVAHWRHLMGECLKKEKETVLPAYGDELPEDAQRMRHCLAVSLQDVQHNMTTHQPNNGVTWNMFRFNLYMENEMDRGISLMELDVDGYDNDWDYVELEDKTPDVGIAGEHGMDLLIDSLAEGLDVRLGQRVVRIDHDDRSCNVTTETGEMYKGGKACIVTLPLGVLKERHDSIFHPSLPAQKKKALQRAGISAFNTLVVEWKFPVCQTPAVYMMASPLSMSNPLSAGFLCPEILRSNYSLSSSHVTQFYISGTVAPDGQTPLDFDNLASWKQKALEFVSLYEKFSAQERDASGRQQQLTLEDIVSIRLTNWHTDPDFLGSFSAPIAGTRGNDDRQSLRDPVGKALYFAGEHTNADGRYQTIDGAYDSGVMAARALLKNLVKKADQNDHSSNTA